MPNITGQLMCILVMGILLGGLLTFTIMPTKTETIIKEIPVDRVVYFNILDNQSINDISDIKTEILKDTSWKEEAIEIAIEEMEERDYKNIYNFLISENISIVDRDDIEKVIITDVDVTNLDVDEEEAIVIQSLKCYYEDADGDDKKVYLILTTEIDNGEIDDTEYELD